MHGRRFTHFDHPGPPGPGPGHGEGPGPGRWRGRGPGRHGRGRRNRVSRGEVRSAILRLLTEEPMHGYQIMQEMEERSGGGWQPSPGSIYPTLQQLADEDLVVSESRDGKNVFSLTETGRAAAAAIDEPPAWERFGGEGMAGVHHLRRSMFALTVAVKQVAATGSERQIEAARAVLTDARKALYRLLAEDDD